MENISICSISDHFCSLPVLFQLKCINKIKWKFPSSSTEKKCVLVWLTVRIYEDFHHIKATRSLSKALQACLSVMFCLSSSSPQTLTSPHLSSTGLLHHLYLALISSSAPQLNAVQICSNSSKPSLLKYAGIDVNCPCWLRITFLYSSKLDLTQPKSASNVLTLTCFSQCCALFRKQW